MEITLLDGTTLQCEDEAFNAGAEAELFWTQDKKSVIKLYYNPADHTLQTLKNIIGRYNLTTEDSARSPYFAWPDAVVTQPKLGIRMPAVEQAQPLDHYIRPSFWKQLPITERGSWQTRVSIAYRMARIIRWMHLRGLCHSDLSPKNFMVNIHTGQTTLIDCDGLVVPNIQPPSVLGTPQCMAPELVMGSAKPTVNTDKHALAVLIYWTLLLRHPLQGPKVHHEDPEKDEQSAFGDQALYIEHPTDHSNRPERFPFTSELLTPAIQRLFERAFIEGLQRPARRPSAAEWEVALIRLADRVIPCLNDDCPMQSYVVPETKSYICPWCQTRYQTDINQVPVLSLYRMGNKRGIYTSDNWSIIGLPNRPLRWHHIDAQQSPDLATSTLPAAHFELDGQGRWYLVNDGLSDALVLANNQINPFRLGSRVELIDDAKILLGSGENYRMGQTKFEHLAP
ncbi:MAG: hypothetical protein AAF629_17560 [Chloroflexota bacterium]